MSRTDVFGTACITCRRRGRKCDRNLPTCTSCGQRGVNCEGYVLRWVGLAARGPLAGQTYTANPHGVNSHLAGERRCPCKAERPEINIVESHLHAENYQVEAALNAKPPEAYTHAVEETSPGKQETNSRAIAVLRRQSWRPFSVMETSGDNLEGLIEYYGRELSTAFYLGDGPVETPYASHILPLTRSMPSVRCAVAALASCHIGNRLDYNQLKRQSLHLRIKAMQLLREDLKSSDGGPDLGCLVCMLLLAQLDLCSGDCIEFGTHLEAARKFVKSRGSDGTERGFFEQRLVWLDIMGATTTSRMPHWTSNDIKATLNKFRTPSGREWSFDVFYCPIDLLEYIADITVLYKVQPDTPKISQDAIQEAILLGNAVERWDATPYDSDPRSHIVEVWRLAIILYLIRLFQFHNDIFNTAGLINSIFHHARAIPVRTSWNVSITWPLFQAGLLLSTEHEEAKTWLRNELLANFENLGCFNLSRAVQVLEQVWKMGDDESYDFFTFGSPQYKLIL